MTLSDELSAVVRAHLADRPGASWRALARDLGVAGLLVPERYGGAGCGPAEAAAVAEELGRVLSPHPFLQSAVMAVGALMAEGTDDDARGRLADRLRRRVHRRARRPVPLRLAAAQGKAAARRQTVAGRRR